ncbi:MAG: filamentous hemagglutinin N-terminal domain-containing protein [Cyanobacteriota bacterium]|nr:filamentous hemagglutinin N-terminal domain-containing protein [Cyanobacteriota bacterium]
MTTQANSLVWPLCAAVFSLGLTASPTLAQITPDATLPNNSIVLPNGNIFTIDGGTQAGTNLFHSFEEFSIPTGNEAFFDNALTIDNIITRVTGGNLSDIDGLIRANGTANLFLINPNGIQFGPNARLDIGGSFLGSTADSLLFEDGSFYSAVEANAPPLLTVNVPVGLQMGTNPGDIQVNGGGHTLTSERPILSPIQRGESLSGLQVRPAQTLALVGGQIDLNGGVLLADSGRIELGSIDSGVVRLDAATQGWELNYEEVQGFRDIHLFDRSLVDASGFLGNGSIQVRGRNLSLSNGSVVLVQNMGEQASGAIRINASESVEIGGFLREIGITSGFFNETLGSGAAGDIEISTRVLTLQDGGMALARTFSDAKGGSIIANASESIDIIGFASPDSSIRTALLSSAFDTGDAGEIQVSTQRLTIANGGLISTSTVRTGDAGNIIIEARESVDIFGADLVNNVVSLVSASTYNRGNAGTVTIDTQQLRLQGGARIISDTFASGAAGSITLNASESIEVGGKISQTEVSRVRSSAERLGDPLLERILQLPPVPDGLSGDVTINTSELRVTDEANISVGNIGPNNAGDLQINATSVVLDRQGTLTASTASGAGGNIDLQVRDSLQLRGHSSIEAEAGGLGNGGNLAIDANTIALLENSSINANAIEGAGGNIEISTSGLFVSPQSNITASSQFGVDGLVSVNSPVTEPASGLVALSSEPLNPNTQIQNSCDLALSNRFSITGNGGLPAGLAQPPSGQTVWRDTRLGELDSELASNSVEAESESLTSSVPLVEATGWRTNPRGQVELVAASSNLSHSSWQPHPECDRAQNSMR